jgi:hypothetical protein
MIWSKVYWFQIDGVLFANIQEVKWSLRVTVQRVLSNNVAHKHSQCLSEHKMESRMSGVRTVTTNCRFSGWIGTQDGH